MSTRPRIEFDKNGWCNACQWMEEKKIIDWKSRQRELKSIIKKYKSIVISIEIDCAETM